MVTKKKLLKPFKLFQASTNKWKDIFFSECFLRIVKKRDQGTLVSIIQQSVASGTEIHSNEWDAYRGLSGRV